MDPSAETVVRARASLRRQLRLAGATDGAELETFDVDTVVFLREQLGARLLAYVCSERSTRTVASWIAGASTPDQLTTKRLLLAAEVVDALGKERGFVPAWMQGMNRMLGDRSPARAIREGEPEDVEAQLLIAARVAYLS